MSGHDPVKEYARVAIRKKQEEAEARVEEAAPDLLAALKRAAYELNAIRAQDGAPQHIDWYRGRPLQTDSCTHEMWNDLTDYCFAAIAKAEGEK